MRFRTSVVSWTTSWPITRAVPLVGSSSVISILIVVVLPAPFGPSSPNSSPGCTSKLTPRTAGTSSRLRRRTPVWVRYVRTRSIASIARLVVRAGGGIGHGDARERWSSSAGGFYRAMCLDVKRVAVGAQPQHHEGRGR